MSEPRKSAELWFMRLPIGKRWKLLRYSFWFFCALVILTLAFFPDQPGLQPTLFPSLSSYLYALSFFIWATELLGLPSTVRWMGTRLRLSTSLFRKLSLTLAFISVFSSANLFLTGGAFYFLNRYYGFHLSEHPLFLLYLGLLFSSLNGLALLMMAKDLTERMSDSLRVVSNGMNMAAKLDFDAPIVTPERDEIGRLSEAFGHMTRMIKTRVSLLHTLFNNVRIFSGLLAVDKILDHTLKTFESLKEADQVIVALCDDTYGELTIARTTRDSENLVGLRFPKGKGVFGTVIQQQQFLIYNEKDHTRISKEYAPEARICDPTGVVAIPMLCKGKLKGAIGLYGLDPNSPQLEAKMDYFQALANQIANFLENARLYELVIRDRLTGLYVHSFIEASLEDQLAQAKRYKFPVTFLMLDADKFKNINDQYGHPAGNRVITALSDVIKKVSRDADVPARYGGDEFEVLLPHTDQAGAMVYAEKLREAVEQMTLELAPGVQAKLTISVGLACFPQDVQTAAQLQAAADDALYGAKAKGRNCIVPYSSLPK